MAPSGDQYVNFSWKSNAFTGAPPARKQAMLPHKTAKMLFSARYSANADKHGERLYRVFV